MPETSSPSLPRPVAIDLFSGAGGLSLGFEMGGFDVISAVEYDPVHAATHLYNFPLTDTLCRDVRQLSAEDLRSSARRGWRNHNPEAEEWDGALDVLIGGPSCQGFSVMGKQDEDDDRNRLIFEFVRFVEELRPKMFVMENVPGFLGARFSELRKEAFDRLQAAGYQITGTDKTLLATDYGVPQKRRRVVVVGSRTGTSPMSPTRTVDVPVTVAEAFLGLPDLDDYADLGVDQVILSDLDRNRLINLRNPYLNSLYSESAGYLAHPRVQDNKVLTGCKVTVHKSTSIERFEATAQGAVESVSRAYRLDESKPALTLRAGTGRERGAFSASRPLHPRSPRVITVREAARLHSFPDWFRFHTTNWHGHRQIGNAVPPLLARAVAASILDALSLDARAVNRTAVTIGQAALLSMSPTTAAQWFEADDDEVPRTRARQQKDRKGQIDYSSAQSVGERFVA
ncbi:DNA (cytosine-5-)-methyltransferase [Cryobacterium sp. LW097]|uniref:DNA cytosine methyltransferase n=1 Tax=Cryobacterium sp. LW097 TaxID=1978566 RepID=UPI000B4D5378|nr:DNA cytosine methyltransferase [Cryobacterium sp. LW097]ASD22837.1 DNA (cytosine-5-)-methyltransferase [Cryobacterium sp. LW097]